MPGYVALLGSINVGGNRVTMADLTATLELLGLRNVKTVVASGNVIFDHPDAGDAALSGDIEAAIRKRFGFASFVAMRNRDEIAEAIAANPFAGDGEPRFVHTLFLERPVD